MTPSVEIPHFFVSLSSLAHTTHTLYHHPPHPRKETEASSRCTPNPFFNHTYHACLKRRVCLPRPLSLVVVWAFSPCLYTTPTQQLSPPAALCCCLVEPSPRRNNAGYSRQPVCTTVPFLCCGRPDKERGVLCITNRLKKVYGAQKKRERERAAHGIQQQCAPLCNKRRGCFAQPADNPQKKRKVGECKMRRGSKRRGESVFVFCVGFVCAESAKPAAHCKKYILTRVEKRTKRGGGYVTPNRKKMIKWRRRRRGPFDRRRRPPNLPSSRGASVLMTIRRGGGGGLREVGLIGVG